MSKHKAVEANATCPFFANLGDRHIRCEGITDNTSIKIGFTGEADKMDYFFKACCQNYRSCPIRKMIMAVKYDD